MLDGSRNEKDEGDELCCDPLNSEWLLLQHEHINVAVWPVVNIVAEIEILRVSCSSAAIRHIVLSQVAQRRGVFDAAVSKRVRIDPPQILRDDARLNQHGGQQV